MNQFVRERFAALAAEGVTHFPLPESRSMALPAHLQEIQSCRRCGLCERRPAVFVAPVIERREFLFLFDYPEEQLELAADWLTTLKNSIHGTSIRLAEKLQIVPRSHFSLAIKCPPDHGNLMNSRELCIGNLAWEIAEVNPRHVFVFGAIAMSAWMSLPVAIRKTASVSNFPSSLELERFPKWRTPVWNEALAVTNRIDKRA